jgi:hypothetical protein
MVRIATAHHIEMARPLAALWAAVSSPIETFWVDIVDELLDELWEQARRRTCLENFGMRIYDLILGPPSSRVRLADHLEKVV